MAEYVHKGYINAPGDEIFDIRYEFVIISSEELSFDNDVTEYVTEDGSTLQEHIVQKPIHFTLEGYVAEKIYVNQLEPYTSQAAEWISKLQPIAALLPEISSYAQTAIAATNKVESTIRNTYKKVKDLRYRFGVSVAQNIKLQRLVASELKALSRTRTLVGVSSSLGDYKNMLIKSVNMMQEDTYEQSRLRIELQQYNSATAQLTYVNKQQYADRTSKQAAQEQNLGRIQGKMSSTLRDVVPTSLVPSITGGGQ